VVWLFDVWVVGVDLTVVVVSGLWVSVIKLVLWGDVVVLDELSVDVLEGWHFNVMDWTVMVNLVMDSLMMNWDFMVI
jgi:hypothetical protein